MQKKNKLRIDALFAVAILFYGLVCGAIMASESLESEHYCPVCKINFSSLALADQPSSTLKSLDGRPLNRKPAPLPDCPLCGGVFIKPDYSPESIQNLERAVWSAEYQKLRQHNSYYRHARLLELTKSDSGSIAIAWLQVAWTKSPESEEYKYALTKSTEYFEEFFLLKEGISEKETFVDLRLKYVDVLRQQGRFDKALKQLKIVSQENNPKHKVFIRVEKNLIESKNTRIHEFPDGNKLHRAVLEQDTETCKTLLKNEKLSLERNLAGLTPLQLAVKLNRLKMVEILSQVKVAINLKSSQGQTALHMAVAGKQKKMVFRLIESKALPSAKNASGQSALAIAAKNGCWEIFSFLLTYSDTGKTDSGGNTLLHLACAGAEHERTLIVKKLIELNADVNARNHAAYTPLHVAVVSAGIETVKLLLTNGAKIDARLATGETPLFLCRNDLIEILIDSGADINLQNNKGETPFVAALLAGDFRRVAAFKVSGKFGVIPEKFEFMGAETTIWAAATSGNLEQLRNIIDREPLQLQLHEVEFGETALHRAVLAEQTAAAQLLLNAGADPSVNNNLKRTPLHYAAAKGNLKLVKILVESGSNIFALDARGSTPLHEAAAAKHRDVYEFLLQKGASDSTRNNSGYSARQLLEHNFNIEK
jgi:ankyrin repeat protein